MVKIGSFAPNEKNNNMNFTKLGPRRSVFGSLILLFTYLLKKIDVL